MQEKINRSYYERHTASVRSPSYDKENKVPQINLYHNNSLQADPINSPRRNPHQQPYIISQQ